MSSTGGSSVAGLTSAFSELCGRSFDQDTFADINRKFAVKEYSIAHPSGGHGQISYYIPQPIPERMPVIVFAPKLNCTKESYHSLLMYLAGGGYAVLSSTYKRGVFVDDADRYNTLMAGYDAVIEMIKNNIDTTRIGFVGHSYGSGALPAISWEFLMKRGWGQNGTFMFLMSPSYVHCFSQNQFDSFPPNVNLIIQVYEDDHFNDYRIAEDIFYSININPICKDFLFVRNASESFEPDYQFPECDDEEDIPFFCFAVLRPIEALAKYTFFKDTLAYKIALGNGNPLQVFMGCRKDGTPVMPMYSTDIPVFRNMKWLKKSPIGFFADLVNPVWPVTMFSSFDDKRNERRFCPVP